MNQRLFQSFRIPSLLLAALLQCMPMVRAALPVMQSASNILAIVFRWSAAAAAALGTVQAVSGASTVITTGDITATNGIGSTNRLLTAPQTAGWWSATGMPPGINLSGSGSRWYLQGVPTAVGVWNVALVAKSSATAGSKETTSKTIKFTVVDGGGSGGGNSPPVANSQSVTTAEDSAKAITLTGTDADGDTLTYIIVALPGHGTLSGSGASRTYTPAANYNGNDSFTFKVNDGTVDSPTATVSITVTAVNDAPVANAQSVTTAESTAKSIVLTGSDVEGSALTYTVMTQSSHGTLSGTAPNLTYTPTANYNGSDSFTFRVSDGSLNSATATVSITVTAVNDPPVANAQNVTTAEDTAKAITLSGSDPDGNTLTYAIVLQPVHGTLSGTPPNVTYTPAANYNGSDSFTFKANDGMVDSSPATVSLSISAVNDAPVANAQSVGTDKNVAKTIVLSGSDVDDDSLTYTIVAQPSKGVLSGSAPNLTYTPNSNATGADSFTFRVSDGALNSATATVSITIAAGPNTAPVASAQNVSTAEDTAKAIILSGTDADGDPLTFAVTAAPAHGTLSGTAPNLTYTPAANFNGGDSFAFKVNDGIVDSAAATVSISVTVVNDAPVANAQSVSTPQDTAKAITLSASDADGDALTYSVTAQPAHGSLSGTAPNLTYTPTTGYKGADSFAFKVNDGTVDSAIVTVSINVTAVNHPPVASAQSVTTAEDTAKAITLQAVDSDGDTLSYAVTAQPSHGTLSGTAPNLIYTPAANYSGSDGFTFKANDGTMDSAVAAVSIIVTAVNDAPTLNAIANVSLAQNAGAKTVSLSGISAGPGESQTLSITASSSNPSLIPAPTVAYNSPSASGSLSFTPAADATGTATITVTVDDGGSENSTFSRSFVVTVEAANSPITIDPIPNMTISASAPQQRVALTGIGTAQAAAVAVTSRAGLTPWLQAIIDRLAQHSGATLKVTATSSDTTLIPTPNVIYTSPGSTGTLLFKPVPNVSGEAILAVTVSDGRNAPVTRSFTVVVSDATNTNDFGPAIVLTAPRMNTRISAPATISLAASVNPNGHSISKVQFFAGSILVGEDSTAPYAVEWDCPSAGSYTLLARAFHDSNGFVDSAAVIIHATDLPAPWETADVGNALASGDVMFEQNQINVEGAGRLGGTTDSFRFLYQTLSADGKITVRLDALDTTDADARVGVMIRENLTAGSPFQFVGLSPDMAVHWLSRDATGAAASDRTIGRGTAPIWLRLERRGNLVIASRSLNGKTWSLAGLASLKMASNTCIGIAVASGDEGMPITASFNSVVVVP